MNKTENLVSTFKSLQNQLEELLIERDKLIEQNPQLELTRYKLGQDKTVLEIHITQDQLANFKLLINKALNCWTSAPAEIKEFGDLVTNDGKVWQNYEAQR